MKKKLNNKSSVLLLLAGIFLFISCDNDDNNAPELTGNQTSFDLQQMNSSGNTGTVTFAEQNDNSTLITIEISGTSSGDNHPAHIHLNSAAEGGEIAIDLQNVNGATGSSETVILQTNNGNAITYEELINMDAHINVHLSAEDLGTIISQGDIGENILTGNSATYELNSVSDPNISGNVTFAERVNSETLVTIQMDGTTAGTDHPTHIHNNTAAEGGGVAIPLNTINGATGTSQTNVSHAGETSITYNELLNFDGYVNVHKSSDEMGVSIGQGDIGQNALTGNTAIYPINSVSDPNISGNVTFAERVNGETLVTIEMDGTNEGTDHPTHIHSNTAAEGGGVAIPLTTINGATGISHTNVSHVGETSITYDELLDFDGYINVHKSASEMGISIGQGDVGQNALTGNTATYPINSVSDPNISGNVTFAERVNGETLITIQMDGTNAGTDHPTHIHNNTAAEGGGVAIPLTTINGATGSSQTNVSHAGETPITYNELLDFNGYVNVHKSSGEMGISIGQGDIGQNALTGNSATYPINSVSDPNISGNVTFAERMNSETLVTIQMDGTTAGTDHPTHIHSNTAAEGGGVAIPLTNINGATGISHTNISHVGETPVTYDELLDFDGYVNVHKSSNEMGISIGEGDIGQNALTGNSATYTLNSVSDPNISGDVNFAERANGETLVTIQLDGTVDGGDHPAHIHHNSVADGGGVAIPLANVNGATGISRTNVSHIGDVTINYDELINFDGHVNVHKSSSEISTYIAQGNIGSNE